MHRAQRSSQFAYLLQCQPGIFGYFLKRLIILKHTEHKILSGLCATIGSTFFISHLSVFHYSLHVSHIAQLPSWVIPESPYFGIKLPGIIIRHFPGRDIIYQIRQFLAYPVPVSLCIYRHTNCNEHIIPWKPIPPLMHIDIHSFSSFY